MWDLYSCDKCNNYPLLAVLANHTNETSSFLNWCNSKGGARCAAVAKEKGGKAIADAVDNGTWGNKKYFIKPDKTFKDFSSSDISSNGITKHVCNGNDTQNPTVSITSPGNNEKLMVGTDYDICWDANDNIGVVATKISFCSIIGSWSVLDSSANNNSSFSWTVPDEVSNTCQIKISAYDAAGNVGEMESDIFEIEHATNIIKCSEMTKSLIKFKNTAESFMVYIPFSQNFTITISDMRGRNLHSKVSSGKKQWYTYPLSLNSGIYFVNIKVNDKLFSKKLEIVK